MTFQPQTIEKIMVVKFMLKEFEKGLKSLELKLWVLVITYLISFGSGSVAGRHSFKACTHFIDDKYSLKILNHFFIVDMFSSLSFIIFWNVKGSTILCGKKMSIIRNGKNLCMRNHYLNGFLTPNS